MSSAASAAWKPLTQIIRWRPRKDLSALRLEGGWEEGRGSQEGASSKKHIEKPLGAAVATS